MTTAAARPRTEYRARPARFPRHDDQDRRHPDRCAAHRDGPLPRQARGPHPQPRLLRGAHRLRAPRLRGRDPARPRRRLRRPRGPGDRERARRPARLRRRGRAARASRALPPRRPTLRRLARRRAARHRRGPTRTPRDGAHQGASLEAWRGASRTDVQVGWHGAQGARRRPGHLPSGWRPGRSQVEMRGIEPRSDGGATGLLRAQLASDFLSPGVSHEQGRRRAQSRKSPEAPRDMGPQQWLPR